MPELYVFTHEFILIVEERSMIQDEQPLPEHPEIVVFAAFSGPPKYPVRISVLGEMVRIANIYSERKVFISIDTILSIQKSQLIENSKPATGLGHDSQLITLAKR